MTTCFTHINTPLGKILVLSDAQAITGLYLVGQKHEPAIHKSWQYVATLPLASKLESQIHEYLAKQRRQFDIPIRIVHGTDFQQSVWRMLSTIPYGALCSYSQLSTALSKPTAVRAVAQAIAKNPLLLLVPCHRVIGSDGTLKGFAAGLQVKKALLDCEK